MQCCSFLEFYSLGVSLVSPALSRKEKGAVGEQHQVVAQAPGAGLAGAGRAMCHRRALRSSPACTGRATGICGLE